jgi:hypothetical protein
MSGKLLDPVTTNRYDINDRPQKAVRVHPSPPKKRSPGLMPKKGRSRAKGATHGKVEERKRALKGFLVMMALRAAILRTTTGFRQEFDFMTINFTSRDRGEGVSGG